MAKAEKGGVYRHPQGGYYRVLAITQDWHQPLAEYVVLEQLGYAETPGAVQPLPSLFVRRSEFEARKEGVISVDLFEKVQVLPRTARPSWDTYFMQVCHLVATRAPCNRKHVGAVIIRDRRILTTGYNGSAPGEPHCDDAGHDLVTTDGRDNCVRTIHAEANAILQASKEGISLRESILYVNTFPCWPCAKMILSAGIQAVVFDADYNNDARVEQAFKAKKVSLLRYKIE